MKHGHRRKVAEGCYKGIHYDYSSDVPQGIRMLRDEEDKDMITMTKKKKKKKKKVMMMMMMTIMMTRVNKKSALNLGCLLNVFPYVCLRSFTRPLLADVMANMTQR